MRAIEFLKGQSEVLDEVSMKPTQLKQMAAQTGAIAGIEFEMVVPDVNIEIDGDYEPDFDYDEEVGDFDSIEDFFSEGDINYSGDIRSLIADLKEDYLEWVTDQQNEQWDKWGRGYFEEYAEDYFDSDEAREEAEEEIRDRHGKVSKKYFEQLVDKLIEEKKQDWLDYEWKNEGRLYDLAREAWEENEDLPDERDFLRRNQGYRYMSDLPYEQFRVYWPYLNKTMEPDIEEVVEGFKSAINRPVKYSTSYHGAAREKNTYVIEPDSSIKASRDDAGLEFVSPPLPLDDMLSDLSKVIKWAKVKRCYTNDSTGLHMNVSVPNFSRDNLDYVKLALLLGDKYVLNQFGRAVNTYTKSALADVINRIQQSPEDAAELLQQMKTGLGATASKVIHSGITGKYVSINTHTGYIEFRSPGGNWLEEDFSKLENTLLRFVVALDAACDPQKYRQEYLKKLYAVLQPKSDSDPITLFAKYSAGELKKGELQQYLKQIQLQRKIKKAPAPASGQLYWWEVSSGHVSMEVVAKDAQEAIQNAIQLWDVNPGSPFARALNAKPVRPYTTSN